MNDQHESVVNFEREIGGLLKGRQPPPPAPQDIGRLSAEAVLKQWEETAKAFESLGVEVKERAAKLEAALRDCDQDLELLAQAAQKIRSKGEALHDLIAEASSTSNILRDLVADANGKVA